MQKNETKKRSLIKKNIIDRLMYSFPLVYVGGS